jgi:hypothetical protein
MPWFEKAVIHLENGKTFSITAPGAGAGRPYVQTVALDGRNLTRSFIDHAALADGGSLSFTLGAAPSTWARAAAESPVARIDVKKAIVPVPFVARGSRVFEGAQQIALGCADPLAKIEYVFLRENETPQRLRWQPYRRPLQVGESSRIVFRAKRGRRYSQQAEAVFSRRTGTARVERYAARYSNQYTGGGEQGLVDGLRGAADFRMGQWQGFEGVSLDVVIDLGKVQPVRRVTTGFLQDENAWIFLPEAVRVELSSDGKSFTPAGTPATNAVDPRTRGVVLHDFIVEADGQPARYVRVVGVNRGKCPEWHKGAGYNCWVFADEILIE